MITKRFCNIKSIISAVRDLVIYYLPCYLNFYKSKNIKFAFLAHPLYVKDLSYQYPFTKNFLKNTLKFISRYLWTVIGSKITGFKDAEGNICNGWIVYCPLTAHMLVLKRKLAIKKLLRAVKFIEKFRVKIIGLGAFVPIITGNGSLIRNKTSLKVVTGASFSAVIGFQNTITALKKMDVNILDCQIAIVGAGGSVGSIISQLFAKNFSKLILIDKNRKHLDRIASIVTEINNDIQLICDTSISSLIYADSIFVATNTPGVIVRANHLKSGVLVVDSAYPHNVSIKVPKQRNDVLVIESGIVQADGVNTNIDFGLHSSNEIYSCLAEVLILLWNPKLFEGIKEETLLYAETLLKYSSQAGINPARFQNRYMGYITNDFFKKISNIRNNYN